MFPLCSYFCLERPVFKRYQERVRREEKLSSIGVACVGVDVFASASASASVAKNGGVVVEG